MTTAPEVRIPTEEELRRITRRAVQEIIPEEEFVAALRSGRRLRLKMGFDPSRPDLHLGHAVGLRKLRQLQELGHQVVVIVGDWTAQIGDPSGQSQTRPMLTAEEVKENAQTYLRQLYRIVDREMTEVRLQSEWFGDFTLADVIRLSARFTVAQMLRREDFAQRYESHKPIGLHEFLYPLLQAYDSVAVQADVEFGGSDQRFNLLVGRELQEMMGQRPQAVFIMPLLLGTDGAQKMSKSLGNYIAFEDPPNEMYGKVMSIPDTLILEYFELTTDVPDDELQEIGQALETRSVNPMELKMRLAREIVTQFYDAESARDAEERFRSVFQRREIPKDIPVLVLSFSEFAGHGAPLAFVEAEGPSSQSVCIKFPDGSRKYLKNKGWQAGITSDGISVALWIPQLLAYAGLVSSTSEATRLERAGAISRGGEKIELLDMFKHDDVIEVGKRRFLRIVDADKQADSSLSLP